MHVCCLLYLQIVILTVVVALHVKIVKEEGNLAVLWRFQDDCAIHVVGVDVRPPWTLQVAILLFVGSATAWKPPEL